MSNYLIACSFYMIGSVSFVAGTFFMFFDALER